MMAMPEHKQTEVGMIPYDWDLLSLGDIAQITSGKRLPKGRFLTEVETPHPYIRVSDMRVGTVSVENILFVPVDVFPAIQRYRIFSGEIFISVAGTLGLVGAVPRSLNGASLTENADRVSAIRCSEGYLLHVLISPIVQSVINSIQTIGAQPKLALTRIRKFQIPLPPTKPEQEAIAEALSDADALIESLEQLIAKKRQIKQGAMQQLLTGRKRLPGFTGEWDERPLAQIAEIRSGGTPSTANPSFWNGGVAWCTPTDITALRGGKYLTETERTISKVGLRASSAEIIPPSSVIMTTRATIGECALNTIPVTTNQGFKNLIPFEADAEFLYYLMTMQKDRLIQLCGGSTFLEVGKKQLQRFEIMLPSNIDEQRAIARFLSDIDAEIEALEQRRAKTAALKQAMMQELLTGRIRLPGAKPEESAHD